MIVFLSSGEEMLTEAPVNEDDVEITMDDLHLIGMTMNIEALKILFLMMRKNKDSPQVLLDWLHENIDLITSSFTRKIDDERNERERKEREKNQS